MKKTNPQPYAASPKQHQLPGPFPTVGIDLWGVRRCPFFRRCPPTTSCPGTGKAALPGGVAFCWFCFPRRTVFDQFPSLRFTNSSLYFPSGSPSPNFAFIPGPAPYRISQPPPPLFLIDPPPPVYGRRSGLSRRTISPPSNRWSSQRFVPNRVPKPAPRRAPGPFRPSPGKPLWLGPINRSKNGISPQGGKPRKSVARNSPWFPGVWFRIMRLKTDPSPPWFREPPWKKWSFEPSHRVFRDLVPPPAGPSPVSFERPPPFCEESGIRVGRGAARKTLRVAGRPPRPGPPKNIAPPPPFRSEKLQRTLSTTRSVHIAGSWVNDVSGPDPRRPMAPHKATEKPRPSSTPQLSWPWP